MTPFTTHPDAVPGRSTTGLSRARHVVGFRTLSAVVAGSAALAALTFAAAAPSAATTAAKASTPNSVKLVTGDSGTVLTWRPSAGSGYVVQQSTDKSFSAGISSYRLRGPFTSLAPYRLTAGQKYYFRVRATAGGSMSPASRTVSATIGTRESPLRVVAYNSLDASFDGEQHPGGVGAPISQRLPKQLHLLKHSKAAVIGLEEGNSCVRKRPHLPCWRQIDALNKGLKHYALTKTYALTQHPGADYYHGNYVLFNPKLVTPVGKGGDWATGPTHPAADNRFDAYQRFRVNATGAEFLYVVVHTLAPGGSTYDKIRGAETKSTIKHIRAYRKRHGSVPTLVVGDFNSYRGEYRVHDYSGHDMLAAGYSDGVSIAQKLVNAKYDSINALYRDPRHGDGSADHIYTSRQIGMSAWGELLDLSHGHFSGVIPSDHNPVYADVEIPY